MAVKAENRKTIKTTSPPRPMGRFQNNFTGMFLGWPSTKIAKMVLLRWTKWPSKLKIEKPFKRHLLPGQWADFKIISQKCSLDDSLLKLLKWFGSAEQNGRQSKKIEKPFKRHLLPGQWADFKIISQKCSLDDSLLMGQFQNNFTRMFLGRPSTSFAKMVLLHQSKK